jgi:hypothetical protein
MLLGDAGTDSQFEGLTYVASTGHFFAVEEIYDDKAHAMEPYTHVSHRVVHRIP